MHELACPSCNAATQYELRDYLLMCPFCSATFRLDMETGKKEVYADHYIVPNALDARQVKDLITRWIMRLQHNPASVDKEFFVVDIHGYSMPFWVVSLEAHTAWKGLVKRQNRTQQAEHNYGASFLAEEGVFRRNYRWAVSARSNICEQWGMTRLHEPYEKIQVDWDGFPLDSTYSRGRIDPTLGARKRTQDNKETELSAYDVREFFEFKFANGLPILSIQIAEEEALRRAKAHVSRYHHLLAASYVDLLTDDRTEIEIAGVQLVHLPFWHVRYLYRPRSILKHFQKSNEKNVIIEGYAGGVLQGELSMIHRDKLWINAVICLVLCAVFLLAGTMFHSSFFLVSLFFLLISGASGYVASARKTQNSSSSFFYAGDDRSEVSAQS